MNYSFSIIATSYNQFPFLAGMLQMLHRQTFRDFELILIDNNSQDGSRDFLANIKETSYPIQVVLNDQNRGICSAFNQGVKLSKGKYLIDLSPDDVFLPQKLQANFDLLEAQKADLLFSDCQVIDLKGCHLFNYQNKYKFNYQGKANYFTDLLSKHCLASPTSVYSRAVFEQLGGYDQELAYEDFDFLLRASFAVELVYDQQALVLKTQSKTQYSKAFARRNSPVHESTFRVCQKMRQICHTESQKTALLRRIHGEGRAQLKLLNLKNYWRYLKLAKQVKA